jgi:hypothetical protein
MDYIKKISDEVRNIRKVIDYKLEITNRKGEKMNIVYNTFYEDDEIGGYDFENTILDEKGQEIKTEVLEEFFGDDYDDFDVELNDLDLELKSN